MLDRLGRAVVRRRRLILAFTARFFVVAGAVGGGVATHLKTGGYNDPASGSVQAAELLDKGFGAGAGGVVDCCPHAKAAPSRRKENLMLLE